MDRWIDVIMYLWRLTMIDVKLVSLLLHRCYSRVGMVGGDQELGLQVPPDPESAHCVWVSPRNMVLATLRHVVVTFDLALDI